MIGIEKKWKVGNGGNGEGLRGEKGYGEGGKRHHFFIHFIGGLVCEGMGEWWKIGRGGRWVMGRG